MKTKKRGRVPKFVAVSPVLMPDGGVAVYAVTASGEIWEKFPATPWACLPVGGR